MKDDVISRQAAIETVRKAQSIGQAHRMLIQLPSAHPFATDTNVGGNLIDREMALDVLHGYFDGMLETDTVCPKDLYNEIEALPSAQQTGTKTVQVDDCISRQAAISEIMEDIEDRSLHDDPATPKDYAEGYDEGIRNAAAIVLQMPSAQPEIIRCKDCKYNPNPPECGNAACVLFYGMTDQMGFCHHGERRERE